MTLLLAVCEQAHAELQEPDPRVDGLREDIDALTARLYQVLRSAD